jgi:hypothetical protein
MPSQVLRHLLNILRAAHGGGMSMSDPTKGSDRENFIQLVLHNTISHPFRIGSGDIVDSDNRLHQQAELSSFSHR